MTNKRSKNLTIIRRLDGFLDALELGVHHVLDANFGLPLPDSRAAIFNARFAGTDRLRISYINQFSDGNSEIVGLSNKEGISSWIGTSALGISYLVRSNDQTRSINFVRHSVSWSNRVGDCVFEETHTVPKSDDCCDAPSPHDSFRLMQEEIELIPIDEIVCHANKNWKPDLFALTHVSISQFGYEFMENTERNWNRVLGGEVCADKLALPEWSTFPQLVKAFTV